MLQRRVGFPPTPILFARYKHSRNSNRFLWLFCFSFYWKMSSSLVAIITLLSHASRAPGEGWFWEWSRIWGDSLPGNVVYSKGGQLGCAMIPPYPRMLGHQDRPPRHQREA